MADALPVARAATLHLYRTFVIECVPPTSLSPRDGRATHERPTSPRSVALSAFKTSQSTVELVGLVQSFGEKPLKGLSERVKSGDNLDAQLTTREHAFLALCEALVTAVPDSTECVLPLVLSASEPPSMQLTPSSAASRHRSPTRSSHPSSMPARRSTRSCPFRSSLCGATSARSSACRTSSRRAAPYGSCATGSRFAARTVLPVRPLVLHLSSS